MSLRVTTGMDKCKPAGMFVCNVLLCVILTFATTYGSLPSGKLLMIVCIVLWHSNICKRWYCYSRDVRPSICSSFRLSHSGIVSKRTKLSFLHQRRARRLVQIGYQVHSEIRKRSARARAGYLAPFVDTVT